MAQDYISEGVQQAGRARSQTGLFWSDTWKNYATQYALARQAQDDQVELWNLMNEYNKPSAQMARYKEAGLNPMLLYQQGSPGNASSPAGYTMPNVDIHPSRDRATQINSAMQIVGMMSNAAQNVMGLMDAGLNLRLKQNEVAESDLDYATMKKYISNYGKGRDVVPSYMTAWFGDESSSDRLKDALNPLSENFNPLEFSVLSRLGKIPNYFNQYLNGVSLRDLQYYKKEYQKFYNEHLLPKFDEYQQGKIDLQEIEKEVANYNKQALEMIPAPVRGILEPLFDFLGPLLKIVFKKININHNVNGSN